MGYCLNESKIYAVYKDLDIFFSSTKDTKNEQRVA